MVTRQHRISLPRVFALGSLVALTALGLGPRAQAQDGGAPAPIVAPVAPPPASPAASAPASNAPGASAPGTAAATPASGAASPAPAAVPAAGSGVASPTVAAPAGSGPTEATSTAEEAFDLKTKALEEQVSDLKEKILRTKYRLETLAGVVLGSAGLGGAKLAIYHKNELGSSYILTAAAYTLDSAPLYTKVDETGALNDREEFVIFDQRIPPGQHVMAVQYQLRGHGYGIFSYLDGMRLKLTSSYTFNVEPDKVTKVTAIVMEKSGITLQFAQRPDVRFEMSVQKNLGKPPGTAGAQASAGSPASAQGSPQ